MHPGSLIVNSQRKNAFASSQVVGAYTCFNDCMRILTSNSVMLTVARPTASNAVLVIFNDGLGWISTAHIIRSTPAVIA